MAVWSEVRLTNVPPDVRLDAEYYKPEFLTQSDTITMQPHERLGVVAHVSDGNHLAISESFSASGIRYLRGQDLSDFFISDSDPVYIPERLYATVGRSHMLKGDVLVGIVGTIGSVGLVTERHGRLTGNCKLAIVRSRGMEPEFLAAYLSSQVGQNEIQRRVRGSVQMGLILPDLRDLPVPLLSARLRNSVANLVTSAYAKRQESVAQYDEASRCFMPELDIAQLTSNPALSFERCHSETRAARRLDAEFFLPHYLRVVDALRRSGLERLAPLGDFVATLTNGHTPLHHDLSEGSVPFLTAEHIHDFRIDYDSDKRILATHHEGELRRTQLLDGDILITIKGKVGNAAVVEGVHGPYNINQDVALLRLHDGMPSYYVVAFLNSPAGKAFSQQYCTGQINPFLGLGNLRMLPIPVFKRDRMAAVADTTRGVVASAHVTRAASHGLVVEARRRVEDMVLGRTG